MHLSSKYRRHLVRLGHIYPRYSRDIAEICTCRPSIAAIWFASDTIGTITLSSSSRRCRSRLLLWWRGAVIMRILWTLQVAPAVVVARCCCYAHLLNAGGRACSCGGAEDLGCISAISRLYLAEGLYSVRCAAARCRNTSITCLCSLRSSSRRCETMSRMNRHESPSQ